MTKHLLLIVSVLLLISCANSRFGNYYNKKRFYGDMFILKNDSTFIYTHLNKTKDNIEYFDSSSGNFKLVGDTLYLSYLYNLHYPQVNDNPSDSLLWEIVEPHGFYGNRPQKMLWKRNRLYFINEETGDVILDKDFKIQWGTGVAFYLYSRWYGKQIIPGSGY